MSLQNTYSYGSSYELVPSIFQNGLNIQYIYFNRLQSPSLTNLEAAIVLPPRSSADASPLPKFYLVGTYAVAVEFFDDLTAFAALAAICASIEQIISICSQA